MIISEDKLAEVKGRCTAQSHRLEPELFPHFYRTESCLFLVVLPFVAIALKMVKVPNLVQMKLTIYRLKIALGAFRKFQHFSKISICYFTQRHLTMEQNPQTKTFLQFLLARNRSYSRKELQKLIHDQVDW